MEQKVKVRITAVRRRRVRVTALLRAHCQACGREVEALTRREAGEISEIFRLSFVTFATLRKRISTQPERNLG